MTPSIDGGYNFGNLKPGTYAVRLILTAGGAQALPADRAPVVVTLDQVLGERRADQLDPRVGVELDVLVAGTHGDEDDELVEGELLLVR